MRAVVVMLAYAALLVGLGVYAFSQAQNPTGARTALIIPGTYATLMVVCALAASRLKASRKLGMIGIHAGLVLPLVFAALTAVPAWSRTQQLANFPEAQRAFADASAADPTLNEPEKRRAFFRERKSPDHDTAYLRNTLWGIVGLSLATFVALLALRPKMPERVPIRS